MQYIALSGWGHSLRRYFTDDVICLDAPTWGRWTWSVEHAKAVARTINQPTTLIGFSAGATAAVEIAGSNLDVRFVYAHSPTDRPLKTGLRFPLFRFHLFRTIGDTTPTYRQTMELFRDLKYGTLTDLDPVAPEPVRDPATWVMKRRCHQFRNCLPYLPQEIVR